MYPIPPGEHLVENRTCGHCSASFPITDKDLEFYDKVSPVFPKPPGEGDLSKAKKCKAWMSEGQGGSVSFPLDKGFESALLAASYGEAGKGDLVFGKSEQNPPGSPLDRGVRKYLIPPPTLCPDCRQQRRLSFRNERKLYKRKCDATGKDIISIYSPDKPYKVYHQDYWWSDAWDPMDYGREFDFTRGFFEQLKELFLEVPQMGLLVANVENSPYVNYSANVKNCHLIFSSSQNEDCIYCRWVMHNKNIVDCSNCSQCDDGYELIDCVNTITSSYCIGCVDCYGCFGSYDLAGCQHCIGCSLLRNKNYCIDNVQYTKEEYFQKKDSIKIEKELLISTFQKGIHRHNYELRSENSFGEYIVDSKNIFYGFEVEKSEDCKRVTNVLDLKDSIDLDFQAFDCFRCYESMGIENTNNLLFSYGFLTGHSSLYNLLICNNSHHLFGCIGLRNKSYCILNRQYTKEEYEILVPKIIEHMMKPLPRSSTTPSDEGVASNEGGGRGSEWGEFFPASLSPFGYNETVAQEYFPLTREEVIGTQEDISNSSPKIGEAGRGVQDTQENNTPPLTPPNLGGEGTETFLHGSLFNWSDYEPPFPKVEKIIPAEKLPEDISKIPDDILNWAIECEVTRKPFRIIKQELEFYRKHNLPIPRRHPDQRHLDRMALRNPRKLYERLCDCAQCETNNKTSTLSSSEGGSLPLGKGFSQSGENDKGGVHTYREQIPHFELNPKTGTRTKKIITTYSPERKEIVYCEECYNREIY